MPRARKCWRRSGSCCERRVGRSSRLATSVESWTTASTDTPRRDRMTDAGYPDSTVRSAHRSTTSRARPLTSDESHYVDCRRTRRSACSLSSTGSGHPTSSEDAGVTTMRACRCGLTISTMLDVRTTCYSDALRAATTSARCAQATASISEAVSSSIPIPVPPLPEQRRIVAILDEAFEGIATAKANAEKNLQNARELFESYLRDGLHAARRGMGGSSLGDVAECIDWQMVASGRRRRATGDVLIYGVLDVRLVSVSIGELSTSRCEFTPSQRDTRRPSCEAVAEGDVADLVSMVRLGSAADVDTRRARSSIRRSLQGAIEPRLRTDVPLLRRHLQKPAL